MRNALAWPVGCHCHHHLWLGEVVTHRRSRRKKREGRRRRPQYVVDELVGGE